jgi:hypothetical protein
MAATSDTARDRDRTWYGATTVLSLSLVAWLVAGPTTHTTVYAIGVDLFAALLVLAAARSAHAGRILRGTAILLAIALLATAVVHTGSSKIAHDVTVLLVLLVGFVVPYMIGRDIVRRRRIDSHLVMGAITIYLLLGIASTMFVAGAASLTSAPMLRIGDTMTDGAFREQVYFSFVTLSTTGYGDIVPVNDTARAIAIMTALVGQLYLVTAVATAVSLFTGARFQDLDSDSRTHAD